MVGNWRIILTWLGRALVIFPKWWNYEYKDFRLIVEQDSLLRYFKMPAALQRAAVRRAIAGFSMASISLAGLCLTSSFLNTEKARLENSMHTQLGNTVVLQHNNGIQTLYAHLQDIENFRLGKTSSLTRYLELSATPELLPQAPICTLKCWWEVFQQTPSKL